jgi:conjugal transfer mating pair stabilization protein TraG
MSADVEIITYGGGELLSGVFNAISMLFYGGNANGSFVQPLCVISAMIGGAWSISRCFFQSYTDMFLTKYFLPLLALPTILIVPQAKVHIIDKLDIDDRFNGKPIVVDHVPFLFAKIAGMTSFWGYQMTQAIENVMHTPNDAMYCRTGKIFGAETELDFSRLKLTNATVAQNIHHFTQQCVVYDVALGRYTIDEFRKSPNLLSFLKNNTSNVRMIPYVDPETKKMDYFSCKESIEKMDPLFDKEVAYYTKHEVLKKLPAAYQTLLNLKKDSEDRISGQLLNASIGNEKNLCKDIIVANSFRDASSKFAAERAKDNQRNIYQTAGSIAGTTLVTMRIVFEALIYGCFALIVPLALMPGGIKFLGSWIFLNVWIQLWPPLYGIINYITMLCAQRYADSIMSGISNGYSLFTSAGFHDLAIDTASLGGFLSLSVPILSFYLLQNLQSMVHLSGSLLTPAHSSAITAGSEMSTGNYSFSNTSMGQVSYENQTAFQQNNAPSLSSGFFTDNYGTHQIKYGNEILTVNQDPSHLNTTISTAEAYTNSLQNAKQTAQSLVESKQELYTETRGVAERNVADLVQHVASGDSYSNGYSTSETQTAQESANYVKNAAESWGLQHGLSSRESLEYFASLGLEWPIALSVKAGHSGNFSSLSEEGRQSAENLFNSKDFQEHYQKVLSSCHNESSNFMNDEGKRFVENYAASMEKLQSAQEQYSSAHSNMNQISESLSYVQSNTNTVNRNLNTEFSNWLNERGELHVLINNKPGLNCLIDQFIQEKCHSEFGALENFNLETAVQDDEVVQDFETEPLPAGGDHSQKVKELHAGSGYGSKDCVNSSSSTAVSRFKEPGTSSSIMPNLEKEWEGMRNNVQKKAEAMDLSYGKTGDQGESLSMQYETQSIKTSQILSSQHHDIDQKQVGIKADFETENQKIGFERLNTQAITNIQSVFDSVGASNSWSWFDMYSNSDVYSNPDLKE